MLWLLFCDQFHWFGSNLAIRSQPILIPQSAMMFGAPPSHRATKAQAAPAEAIFPNLC
jgi:hypothetical protein